MRVWVPVGRAISPSESVVLDTIRAAAASMVFLAHWAQLTGHLLPLEALARPGVLIFFVLSGFVIAGTTSERATLRSYVIARLARLYSVTLPILLLLPILTLLVVHFWPTQAADFSPPDQPALQWLATATFTTRWWFLAIPSFSDWPFWTLSYEAAFYLVWGAIAFGGQRRLVWIVLAAALVGPNVLLLFPIWLGGAAFFLSGRRFTTTAAILALPVALALFVIGRQSIALTILPNVPDLFADAKLFISDWFRGAAFLLLLASSFTLIRLSRFPFATWVANRSFTLYLLHFPVLRLLVIAFGSASIGSAVMIGAATLAVCFAVASLIELRTKQWRLLLGKLWPKGAQLPSPSPHPL